jgi:hypothetical protein
MTLFFVSTLRAFELSVFVNRWLTPPAEVESAHPGLNHGTAGLS